MDSQQGLPVLQAGGFSASVDAYAWERDPGQDRYQMRLWFLSLLGSQQAVRALWARLIKGEVATLSTEILGTARFCALAPEGPQGWRFFTASLPMAAGFQGVLVPRIACYTHDRLDFLLLPRQAQDAGLLHYRFLNRRLDLPLHPTWADWLWQRALRAEEAVALETMGIFAYRCDPDVEALAADLCEAVARGALGVADERRLPQRAPA
ncbi:MAG: hypothetical protein U0822_08080 [Anaerolineae bacterium]